MTLIIPPTEPLEVVNNTIFEVGLTAFECSDYIREIAFMHILHHKIVVLSGLIMLLACCFSFVWFIKLKREVKK